jgi:hypothetical protein
MSIEESCLVELVYEHGQSETHLQKIRGTDPYQTAAVLAFYLDFLRESLNWFHPRGL